MTSVVGLHRPSQRRRPRRRFFSAHDRGSGSEPCTAPSTRVAPLRSSWPLSSCRVGQQRPGLGSPFSRRCPAPRPDGGLELDERRGHVPVGGRGLAGPEARRVGVGEPLAEHVGYLVATLDGLDVPGEGRRGRARSCRWRTWRPRGRCRGRPTRPRNRPARRRCAPAASVWFAIQVLKSCDPAHTLTPATARVAPRCTATTPKRTNGREKREDPPIRRSRRRGTCNPSQLFRGVARGHIELPV